MAMSMTIACTGVLGRVAVYAPSRRGCVVKAESSAENNPVTGTSTPEGNALKDRVKSKQTAAAVYTPTLADRDTRTPHSG